ncbi:MAG TPA: DUF6526 family protein [Gemmatimonadales bacterium]|jgi:hypothetical protein
MSHPLSQDLKNHARYIPLFHFVAGPIFYLNLLYSIVMAIRYPILDNIVGVAVALALVILFLTARRFATTVQDRVIRLEEQLRFERLLPDDLRNRIPEFTRDQFIALRFASDAELPELARSVLDQRIHDQDAIKQMVKAWRADYMRV